MAPPKTIRCAIYTRKSSEEGLEQDFNSLHAQREACEAYVRSQLGEGWVALPAAYDDGGFSGGSMERPGLRRLLEDIEARKVDVVVVYKVDRLTRSLTDFARIVETFDGAGASFVSVTQAFNTTTSMGRLTLNVLLSFAQFEREVTGERIRDKIAASKAKGLWMGGNVALGYDPDGRTLKINADEAEAVRHIFTRYLVLGSVHRLRKELEAAGYRSKRCVAQNGNVRGGVALQHGAIFHMLSNRLYRGEVPHKGAWHPGQHPPIVDQETFDAVQERLIENAGPKRRTAAGLEPLAPPAPLTGLLYTDAGDRMSPVSARGRSGAVYRYYVAASAQIGRASPGRSRRLAASAIEDMVLDRLQRMGLVQDGVSDEMWKAIREAVQRVEVGDREIRITVRPQAWESRRAVGDADGEAEADRIVVGNDHVLVICDGCVRRRGGDARVVKADGQAEGDTARPDANLTNALARAEYWKRQILGGEVRTINELATADGLRPDYALRLLRLAFLAPDLKRSILDGRSPRRLTVHAIVLEDLPDVWSYQLGRFASGSKESKMIGPRA